MKPWLINKTVLYFEEIFYVDPVNGLDTNDGLSPFTAFKTIRQYARQTIDNSACVLADGSYTVASNDFDNNTNYERTYIGNTLNTRILLLTTVSLISASKTKYTNFIRLKFELSANFGNTYPLAAGTRTMFALLRFKNVLFYNAGFTYNYSYIIYHDTSAAGVKKYVEYHNCTMEGGIKGFHSQQMTAQFAIELTNCVVPTTNDITGAHIGLNKTNLISAINQNIFAPVVDNWRNNGTGFNPDGTLANIGIYGGEFAWDMENTMSITGEDENIGTRTETPVYDYTIDDTMSGTTLNITEKVNDVVIRKIYGAERNHQYTLEVPLMEFWQLGSEDSTLTVTVENEFSEYTRTITFARDVKKNDVMILPTVTTTRIAKLTPTVSYTGQATSVQILVSNNALDENPTWEEATAATQHIFANTTKTAENWAVAMRVTVEGEEGEHITLSPPSFTYST